MSTRGAMGFRIDGTDKVAYNHSDSYPSGLGLDILKALRTMLAKPSGEVALHFKVGMLRVVDDSVVPTDRDLKRLAKFVDYDVNEGRVLEWYNLTRGYQGDMALTLDAGVIEDYSGFLKSSLFCEWAYIVNCDERTFEVYKGWQPRKHSKGRYAIPKRPADWAPRYEGDKFYYPVALVHAWPFDALPSDAEFARFWQRRKHWF